MLTKELFIEAAKRYQTKPVDGIDGCFVRECTRADIKWALDKSTTDTEAEERMVCISACDEAGNLILTRDDVETVKTFGYQAVRKIANAACDINGMTKSEEPGKN